MQRQIGRNNDDRVFRAAARHSRLVRFLRIAIPTAIAAIAGVIVVATFFNPFKLITSFPIDPGKVSLSGTKIVMELPRLTGFTTDARPYEMTARAAAQDITKPDLLELKDIDAVVEMRDGHHVNIKSNNGLYNTKDEVLKLNDHITLRSTSGYLGYLSEATVNVTSGNVVSESPVEVKLPNGVLNANQLQVRESGAVIVFGGGVELTLEDTAARPPGGQGSAAQAAATTPVPSAPAGEGRARQDTAGHDPGRQARQDQARQDQARQDQARQDPDRSDAAGRDAASARASAQAAPRRGTPQ